MKIAQRIGMLVALGFWLAVAGAALGLFTPFVDRMLLIGGAVILLVHAVELISFRRALTCYSQNKLKDAALVLLFGIFHLAKLMPGAADSRTQPGSLDASDAQ